MDFHRNANHMYFYLFFFFTAPPPFTSRGEEIWSGKEKEKWGLKSIGSEWEPANRPGTDNKASRPESVKKKKKKEKKKKKRKRRKMNIVRYLFPSPHPLSASCKLKCWNHFSRRCWFRFSFFPPFLHNDTFPPLIFRLENKRDRVK